MIQPNHTSVFLHHLHISKHLLTLVINLLVRTGRAVFVHAHVFFDVQLTFVVFEQRFSVHKAKACAKNWIMKIYLFLFK